MRRRSDLAGQVALITGASSGIGWATALAFAARGVHVIGVARRGDQLEALAAAVAALPTPHGDFLAVIGDVTDPAARNEAVQAGTVRFGGVDVLVANAGIGHRGALADADWAHIETVLRVNIDGVLHSVRAAVPAMRARGGGHILIISSVMFNLPAPYAATYAASKAAVTSFAESLRLELEPDQIAVSALLVGRTATAFNDNRLGEGKRTGGGIPTMPAEQVAAAVVRAVEGSGRTMALRPFDQLIVWGNRLLPGLMGRLARRQYR